MCSCASWENGKTPLADANTEIDTETVNLREASERNETTLRFTNSSVPPPVNQPQVQLPGIVVVV